MLFSDHCLVLRLFWNQSDANALYWPSALGWVSVFCAYDKQVILQCSLMSCFRKLRLCAHAASEYSASNWESKISFRHSMTWFLDNCHQFHWKLRVIMWQIRTRKLQTHFTPEQTEASFSDSQAQGTYYLHTEHKSWQIKVTWGQAWEDPKPNFQKLAYIIKNPTNQPALSSHLGTEMKARLAKLLSTHSSHIRPSFQMSMAQNAVRSFQTTAWWAPQRKESSKRLFYAFESLLWGRRDSFKEFSQRT